MTTTPITEPTAPDTPASCFACTDVPPAQAYGADLGLCRTHAADAVEALQALTESVTAILAADTDLPERIADLRTAYARCVRPLLGPFTNPVTVDQPESPAESEVVYARAVRVGEYVRCTAGIDWVMVEATDPHHEKIQFTLHGRGLLTVPADAQLIRRRPGARHPEPR